MYALAILLAVSLMWGCSKGPTGPDLDPEGRKSAKVAVGETQGIQQTQIVFVPPVPGDGLEFNSETMLTYSRVKDGKIDLLRFWGENASPSYQARAFSDGEEIGAWTIPIEPGYRVAVTLRVGEDAQVEKKQALDPLPPIPDVPSAATTGAGSD